jgi:hypothetical protein
VYINRHAYIMSTDIIRKKAKRNRKEGRTHQIMCRKDHTPAVVQRRKPSFADVPAVVSMPEVRQK